jgi:acyl carrier protein
VLARAGLEVRDRVTELVGQILAKRNITAPVGDQDDLGEAGMSSLDLVNLMLAVESEFDASIPDRDMTPANFRSIARIEALVTRLLADKCTA